MYKLLYAKTAVKALSKLDDSSYSLITSWLSKNIDACDNPRIHGKALKGNLKGFWRYRIGDYRVIVDIQDKELIVLTITIGHRRDIYL